MLHVTYDGAYVLLAGESSEIIKQIKKAFMGRKAQLRDKKEDWEARKLLQGIKDAGS
jgi:hypothetical protein